MEQITVYPSFILPPQGDKVYPILQYCPIRKCILFNCGLGRLGFLDVYSKEIINQLEIFELGRFDVCIALSPDGSLLATISDNFFCDPSTIIPSQVQIFDISNIHGHIPQQSFFVKPDFKQNSILQLRFFPDNSKLVATNCIGHFEKQGLGSWLKIFQLSEDFWNLEESKDTIDGTTRNNKALMYSEIDVEKQGFLCDEEARANKLRNENDDEFMDNYGEATYFSSLNGFYCTAISPDTLHILAGNNDGELFIIEASSLKVLQCIRAYWYYMVVRGCTYNPLFGHEQFATCDGSGVFNIWNVKTSPNGSEEACSIHKLTLENGTDCCSYSPDGKFVAVSSGVLFKTYIIDSESGCILYSLINNDEGRRATHDLNSYSLFIGHTCQVATVQSDSSIGFWNLPVAYSLETLCLLVLRSVIMYKSIEQLLLPSHMKLRLKYLYV